MGVFAVYFSGEAIATLVQRLEAAYPDKDNLYLVRGEPFTDTVIKNLVPRWRRDSHPLNAAHGGFENRALWEWLEVAQRSWVRHLRIPSTTDEWISPRAPHGCIKTDSH